MTKNAEGPKNPIATEGLKLSDGEYQVVSNVLAAAAQQCKAKQPKIYKVLLRVLGRMSQAVVDGKGVRPDQLEIYQRRIHEAFANQDENALRLAVEDLIASTFRSSADPGLKVAQYLMQLVTQVLAAQARHGLATLEALSGMVTVAIEEWRAEAETAGGKWPGGEDVATWMLELVETGKQDLQLGQEAWSEPESESPSDDDDHDDEDVDGDDEG